MQEIGTIVVTGASSGIGQAVARRLARRKASLILGGRDPLRLEECIRQSLSLGARFATGVLGDINHHTTILAYAEAAHQNLPLSALVNCAGVGHFGHPEDFQHWETVIGTNLTAPFNLIQHLLRTLAASPGTKTIVNVSSDADTVGFPQAAAYCASKAGLAALGRSLRLDLRKNGIRICTLSPGRTDTCFNNKQPGMRPGALQADEVAEAVEFLLFCSGNIEVEELRMDSMSRLND